jgi:hypothetical protein
VIRILVLALVLCGCKKSDPVIARLEQITAKVERMPRAAAAWQDARVGDGFVLGSAVRTGPASRAKLRVGKNGNLDVEADSIVYFTRTPGRDRSDLRIEAGVAELETGDDVVGIGQAVLDPRTRARIEAKPDGVSIVITVGRAMLEETVVEAGQQLTLDAKGQLIARGSNTGSAAAVARPPEPQDTSGGLTIVVRDAPVRVKTTTGTTELAIGEHAITPGTALSIPPNAVVEVLRGGARVITAGPSELRIGDGAALVEVTRGGVALHGDGADAIAKLPGGTLTAKRGGSAAAMVDAKESGIDAQRGETVVDTAKGSKKLAPGQSALLSASGELTLVPEPPQRTVASITAGESPTLHDARAPTPIRVAFAEVCPTGGTVEVAKDRAFKKVVARSGGSGSANVLVPVGTLHYRVRCAGARGATGTLRIAKDSGRTPLPKAAARTTVDMDGREYTILYQNLLPELTLQWRTAPRAAKYTFVIKPTRGTEKRVATTSPSAKLATGELREGSYKVWVEPAGGRRSEESRMVIEFDNAAQSASIDSVEVDGAKLRIKGTVIESSTVSVDATPIDLDRHRRFNTELTPREGEDGVSVRIAHPKAGIHYYVMRTGAP